MMLQTKIVFTTAMALAASSFAIKAQDGLTWTKIGVDNLVGVVEVGCGYTAGVGPQCDAYTGDTPCQAPLPLLCFYDAGLDQSVLLPTPSIYHQWSGGVVATTDTVRGDSFQTIQDANQFCENNFGAGWRLAEFHDGWGWNFFAYGNVGDNYNESQRRFWIDINDQPQATCWSR